MSLYRIGDVGVHPAGGAARETDPNLCGTEHRDEDDESAPTSPFSPESGPLARSVVGGRLRHGIVRRGAVEVDAGQQLAQVPPGV